MKKFKTETFFGERYIYFVRFPSEMLNKDILECLFWAKTWKVEEFYSQIVIRAIVKLDESKKFEEENKGRLLSFKFDEKHPFFEVRTRKRGYTLYEA